MSIELRDAMVTLDVQSEVVRAREDAATCTAREWLVSRVLAKVTSQLVGACEPPFATFPRAPERTLTYTTGDIITNSPSLSSPAAATTAAAAKFVAR